MNAMKNFTAQQLSKKQMNEVKGGANPACPEGTKAFNCILTLGYLGQGTTGIVCAANKLAAEAAANKILAQVMEVTAEDRYVC